jgi:HEPN domain-containing protein
LNSLEKYEKWLEVAKEDLDTADIMLNNGRYSYVAFMCEQAIEKLSKGIYVYKFDKEAPYTHNINIILKDIESIISDERYKDFEMLFSRLTSYYIVGRYDIYKQKVSKEVDHDTCKSLISESKEAFKWLKSQVK